MVDIRRFGFVLSLGLALLGAAAISAQAQDHHHHPPPPHGHPHGVPPGIHHDFAHHGFVSHGYHFGHHDFAHFSPHERALWRGGHWSHAWHNGRYGWWWAVDGIWYFYPSPIYPYPGYVSTYYWNEAPAYQPAYQPGYWYWCPASGAYYPYVHSCPVPWTPVAPTP